MAKVNNMLEQPSNDAQLVISSDNEYITTIAYLPGGRVVTGSENGTVRVWNLQSGEQEGISMERGNEIVTRLVVTQDGIKIISSDTNGQIKIWDVEGPIQSGTPLVPISPNDWLIAASSATVGIYPTEGHRGQPRSPCSSLPTETNPPLRDLLTSRSGPTGSLPDESSPSQGLSMAVDNLDMGSQSRYGTIVISIQSILTPR